MEERWMVGGGGDVCRGRGDERETLNCMAPQIGYQRLRVL